jgi:hypothetical protein
MNSEFRRGFSPQDAPVVSKVTDEDIRRIWSNSGMAHPSITRCFDGSETDEVSRQCSVASNTQIWRGDDGEGFSPGGLNDERWGNPPTRLVLSNPSNSLFVAEFLKD